MMPNLRMKKELADFLKVPVHQLISFSPDPKLLRNSCGECKFWNAGVCDLGKGDRVELPADSHSCKRFAGKEAANG